MAAPTILSLPAGKCLVPTPPKHKNPTQPEIRNKIYTYAAHNAKIVLKEPRGCCWKYLLMTRERPKYLRSLGANKFFGLMQVCRQIRQEFRPMYMAEAKFYRKVREPLIGVLNQEYFLGRLYRSAICVSWSSWSSILSSWSKLAGQ